MTEMKHMSFEGRIVLITGGASGIGAACARLLGAKGAQILIADIDTTAHQSFEGCGLYAIDVSDHSQVEMLYSELEVAGLHVDLLVNCAGIVQAPLPPDAVPQELYRKVMAVDLDGTYNVCNVFGSDMARRGRGSIVNIASVAGMRSLPLHAYSPAKAAVISLTECLAAEWGRSGVRVNAISPGYTITPALLDQIQLGLRDPGLMRQQSALGTLLEPSDIAHAVAFLLSEEAKMITGINLPVDAGWLLAGSWAAFGGPRPAVRHEADED